MQIYEKNVIKNIFHSHFVHHEYIFSSHFCGQNISYRNHFPPRSTCKYLGRGDGAGQFISLSANCFNAVSDSLWTVHSSMGTAPMER